MGSIDQDVVTVINGVDDEGDDADSLPACSFGNAEAVDAGSAGACEGMASAAASERYSWPHTPSQNKKESDQRNINVHIAGEKSKATRPRVHMNAPKQRVLGPNSEPRSATSSAAQRKNQLAGYEQAVSVAILKEREHSDIFDASRGAADAQRLLRGLVRARGVRKKSGRELMKI